MEPTGTSSPGDLPPRPPAQTIQEQKLPTPTPPLTPAPKKGKEKRRPAPLASLPAKSDTQVSERFVESCESWGGAKSRSEMPSASSAPGSTGTQAAPLQPAPHRVDAAACAAAVSSPLRRPKEGTSSQWQAQLLASEGASTTDSSNTETLEVEKIDELQNLGNLGSGASGFVLKQRHLRTGRELALKVIQAGDVSEAQRKAILLELRTFAKCRCPHIVDFYGAFFHENAIHIALEFMDAGPLSAVLSRSGVVPDKFLANMTWQILDGLEYLHCEMHVIHRDIKPSNLLLSRAGVMKITDFGVSGELEDDLQQKDKITFVGTMYYMSPERVRGERYRYDSDMWSLGLTLFESASGRYPYAEQGCMRQLSFWELMKRIVEQEAPKLPCDGLYAAELQDFVNQVLQKEPRNRPSAAMMKTHAWLSGVWPPSAPQRLELAEWISCGSVASADLNVDGAGGHATSSTAAMVSNSSAVVASSVASPSSTPISPTPPALGGGLGGSSGAFGGGAPSGGRGIQPPSLGSSFGGGGGGGPPSAPGSAGSAAGTAPHAFALSRGGRMSGGWPTARSSASAASAASSVVSSPVASPAASPGAKAAPCVAAGVAAAASDSAGVMMGQSMRGGEGYNLFRPRPPVAPATATPAPGSSSDAAAIARATAAAPMETGGGTSVADAAEGGRVTTAAEAATAFATEAGRSD